jgi:hypothetical protein
MCQVECSSLCRRPADLSPVFLFFTHLRTILVRPNEAVEQIGKQRRVASRRGDFDAGTKTHGTVTMTDP